MKEYRFTKKARAHELLKRLKLGPEFHSEFGSLGLMSPVDAEIQYKLWFDSGIFAEVVNLIPELKKHLGGWDDENKTKP